MQESSKMYQNMEKVVQLQIQKLEFDMKVNSFYLSKNPEIREKVEMRLVKLKESNSKK